MERVVYAQFTFRIGTMWLAATERGVCRIGLPAEGEVGFWATLRRLFPKGEFVSDPAPLQACAAALEGYLNGTVREFHLALDLRGTEFQRQVWAEVGRIPYGRVSTYQTIAAAVGRPRACRAAGAANGANPVPIVVPCHRVIGSGGQLTGYGGGLELKQWLLDLESGRRGESGARL